MKQERCLAVIAAGMVFLWGCADPLNGPEEVPAAQDGTALVRVNLNTGSARTALPDISVNAYKAEFFKAGETEAAVSKTLEEQSLTVRLFGGTYNLVVTGYDASDRAVAEGRETVNITGGASTDVTVQLGPSQNGTGTFAYTVTLPPAVTLRRGTLQLSRLSAGGTTDIDLTAGLTGSVPVSSGYYRATFNLVDTSGKVTGKTEIAHIYDGLETAVSWNVTAGEFTDGAISWEAGSSTEFEDILSGIQSSTGTGFTIYITSDFSLDPVPLTDSGYTGKTITIRSRDSTIREISLNANGSLFTVGSGSVSPTLILQDITLKGRISNSSSLVRINGGTLVLKSGGTISGNTAYSSASYYSYGGGVYVYSGGTFEMSGGEISGNTASYGGGVYVSGGTFEMSGGEISGNTASYHPYGGGVYVSGGTFEMRGGEISGNTASSGGGVYVSSGGTFEMRGGEISGNTASYGGGVYVNSGGTFEMRGGTISGNTASYEGGVYVNSGGTFEMRGGEISGNTASYGGGVYVYSGGTFEMSGGTISGNTASSYEGGGVCVGSGGIFTKAPRETGGTSGIIYGSEANGTLKNTARNGGAAVYYSSSKKRETTAGETVSLSTASSANWD